MNMYTPADTVADVGDAAGVRRRRQRVVAVLVVLGLALFIAFLVYRAGRPGPVVASSGPPAVSVMAPGLSPVADLVSATGSLAARHDMPVGVQGEGGSIVAIRAEAGQYVGRGAVLAEIDSRVQRAQLARLQASLAQADADARLAQAELDRATQLVERGFISKADIDRRTATRDSARAQVDVARAAVREMRERIEQLTIRAPEAGLVLERRIEAGQVVTMGAEPLFRIAAGGQIEVRARIAEQDMHRLRVGQEATVTPIGSEQRYAGKLWLLEPLIDINSREGMARILLPASAGLRPGGFANVTIEGGATQRPVVPQSAVLVDGAGQYILIVNGENIVERRDVKIGAVSEAGVAITSGLTGAEQVVVRAGAFLRPGETVTPLAENAPAGTRG